MTARRGWLLPLALVAAATGGCLELTGTTSGVSAIDFTGIPFPSLVTGDTMRDTSGAAAPLRATVYDGSGVAIADADVRYVSLDTGVTIDTAGVMVAARRSGAVRVVASYSGLQSQQRSITVTRAPSDVVPGPTAVGFEYRIPDGSANVSPALTLALHTTDIVGSENANVPGWLVRWRIIYNGDTLAPTDTSTAALWAASGQRHTLFDTTKTDGGASRRLRVYTNLLPLQPDSFIVVAEIKYLGAHVAGSPVRYVVTITPPTL
ncbi:MAG: hypothetical protein KF709_09700 [Gemmatimonadaceae bacterium]|nr:hypothetical protein [Gemmatimonadaceae bacterium]